MLLELKKGVDILSDIGAVVSMDEARKLFEEKCDAENLAKINTIKNEEALLKIANAISLFKPEAVWINSSSESDFRNARDMALKRAKNFH